VVADEGCTTGFYSAGNQTKHIFDPHVVVGIVWPFDQKQVDALAAVAHLADIERNATALIAATQNVEAD